MRDATAVVRLRRPKKPSPWTYIATVASERDADKQYKIDRHPDGRFRCACPSFIFAKGDEKTCKHLLAFLAGAAGILEHVRLERAEPTLSNPQPRARAVAVRVQMGDETFSIHRRAISFEDV